MADIADLAIRARTQGVKKANRELEGLSRAASGARKTVATLGAAFGALAGTGGAVVAATNQVAKAARETQNMADIANVSVEQLQRMSFASREVGVSQQQLSQILLDTQDRIGDFLSTGGGEFQEFFENIAPQVGLTAQELSRMSGPDALMAMYNALEQANLSASETRFYMEALASDASRLIPLLKNNAEGFREAATRADEMNAVLSETEIQNLSDLSDTLGEIRRQFDAELAKSVEENADAIENLARSTSTFLGILSDGAGLFADFGKWLGEETAASINGIANDDMPRLNSELDRLIRLRDSAPSDLMRDQYQEQIEEVRQKLNDAFNANIQFSESTEETSQATSEVAQSAREAALEFVSLADNMDAVNSAYESRSFEIAARDLEELRRQANPALDSLLETEETLRRLENALAQGLIDADEFRELSNALTIERPDEDTEAAVEEWKSKFREINSAANASFSDLGVMLADSMDGASESTKMAVASIGGAMGNLKDIMEKGGEDSFQAYKRLAQAEAAIAGALAVQKALAWGAGGPAGIALAGTIGAMTAVQVAAIEQQEYQGRKTGGQVRSGQSYVVGEEGPEVITMNGGGHVTPNHRLGEGSGDESSGVTVNVNNAPRGTRTEQRTGSDGRRYVDVFIADMANGGPMSKSIQSTFGVKRQGS